MQHITGMAPQDYIKTKLTSELGLSDSDYEWCDNGYGVGSALHGVKLTLPAMAKIGQFYLQQGVARIGDTESDMVTREYMEDVHFNNLIKKYAVSDQYASQYYNATTQNCVPEDNNYDCGNNNYGPPFYSHFIHVDIVRGNYCAIGTAGKLICWTPRTKRVVVIAFDSDDLDSLCDQTLLRLPLGGFDHYEAMDLFQYIDAGLDGNEEYDFTTV